MLLAPKKRSESNHQTPPFLFLQLFLMIDRIATGHAIDLRGHVAGIVGCQEDVDMRQFDRLSRPSQQGFLSEFRQGAFRLPVIQLQRRPDRPMLRQF